MNISYDPSITETLRSLAASTVRGILQTAGVQAMSSEIRQQTASLRSVTPPSNASSGTHLTASAGTSSTTVELSAAAKFPPLASLTAAAAVRTRPSDIILSAALPLPTTLGMLDQQVTSEQKMREVMQLAVKLGQALTEPQTAGHIPERPTTFPVSATAISAYLLTDHLRRTATQEIVTSEVSAVRADAQRVEAMYSQNGTLGYARVDVSPLPSNINTANTEEAAFAATLQVKLPALGDIVITLALNENCLDLAFAASPTTVSVLKLKQGRFRQSVAAWGLNVQGLNFIPFVKEEGN